MINLFLFLLISKGERENDKLAKYSQNFGKLVDFTFLKIQVKISQFSQFFCWENNNEKKKLIAKRKNSQFFWSKKQRQNLSENQKHWGGREGGGDRGVTFRWVQSFQGISVCSESGDDSLADAEKVAIIPRIV